MNTAPTALHLCLCGVFCGALLGSAAPAAADSYLGVKARGRLLKQEMERRGDHPGDVALALANLFAREKQGKAVQFYLKEARKHGVSEGRIDLVAAELYRRVGRFDAAFSTLVRVLVKHPDQPHALVELWKTLYQCALQGTEVRTDLTLVRRKLVGAGLFFPENFQPSADGVARAKELVAAGYSALMAERPRYAAELFEAAVAKNPSNPQAHRGLGIARARMEDFARAAGAYLVYLELFPAAPDADKVDQVLAQYWRHR